MQTKNFQRSGAPLMTPLVTNQMFVETAWASFFSPLGDMIGYGPTINDTHANRIAVDAGNNPLYPPGRFLNYLFYETDRTVFYLAQLVAGVATWVYVGGTMFATLANIPTLGTADAGFEFESSDYGHRHRWSGAAWAFAPGDPGSKYIVAGVAAPLGGLWGLCDGSTYAVAQANGTTANVISPDLTGDIFLQGGAYTGTRKAAARATWEATAVTDDESAHVHNVTVLGEAIVNGAGAAQTVGQDGTVISSSGTAHHHVLSDANAQLTVPSEANGGVPVRIDLAWYLRR